MQQLADMLNKMDGKSYKSLKSIQGHYDNELLRLSVDYVQGDPFAAPSKLRVFIPLHRTDFHLEQFQSPERRRAFKHFFAKTFHQVTHKTDNPVSGTGKSGMIYIDAPGQEVLDRTAVNISSAGIEFRLSCGLPAKGRSVLGKGAAKLLTEIIPDVAKKTIETYSREALKQALLLADDQTFIRREIKDRSLISFIADGAVLPRESGISNKPLPEKNVVPFKSPDSYRTTLQLPSGKTLSGMGIPKGISLIIGGGYHGKSTLLHAIERGVYNHEPGDGREFVLSDESAVKIRSEDGRSVTDVNISPFINDLPFGKDTLAFSSEDASGSTSQAANIVEAIEMRTRMLLIDEDTSATNFMIRDARMQKLVKKDKEPITPFIDRVRGLYDTHGISTVLVLGGSGDYFEAADHVIMMDEYEPEDKTAEAKALTEQFATQRVFEADGAFTVTEPRAFSKQRIKKWFDQKEKVESKGRQSIRIGKTNISLSHVEQLVDPSQTEAIARMIKLLAKNNNTPKTMINAIDDLYEQVEENGLDSLGVFRNQHPGDLALPRKYELAAALNRLRP
ncbi:ABC-ATPase domain-containing protein [Salisediminibacterium halotolerans]|uniref:Predicted ATPase of the ABC class n=1 Tax=Salisediminibacterium halotolerans TaxID=517425 RepID=A0A1H9WH33_9BACI|nr:ABC-ATPase domain-containing protein [Salisediminibacterium haloalkalitolerans]SES32763.1 Predicted ATPase of the ABC class [Salisediminibacterium haloalkalitolerans]